MSPPLLIGAWGALGLALGGIALLLLPVVVARRRQRARWLAWGRGLGLRPAAEGAWSRAFGGLPALEGASGRYPMRLFVYTTGSGDQTHHWMAAAFALDGLPADLDVHVGPENALARLFKRVGLEDVELGDARFDGRYVLRTTDDALARQLLLDPSVQAALPTLEAGVALALADGEVRIVRGRDLRSDKLLQRDVEDLRRVARALEQRLEEMEGAAR